MFGLLDRDIKNIKKAITKYPEIEEVLIFGSRASGNYKKSSDVDMAIKGKNLSKKVLLRISDDLNEVLPLPYYFDIIDYSTIKNQSLKEHIDTVGQFLWRRGNVKSDELAQCIAVLQDKMQPYAIYLLGSAAREELRPDSDIDIAFLTETKVSSYGCFIIAGELKDIFHRDVDLIDAKKASTVFKTQIIQKGKLIYENDSKKRRLFEMVALKEYALLNEERKEIIKGIMERGKIYE